MIKDNGVTYVPSEFIDSLSAEALGAVAWLILKGNTIQQGQKIPFSAIIAANRGSSYKALLAVMDEFVAKGFATSHADTWWVITAMQPHGELKIVVEDDRQP